MAVTTIEKNEDESFSERLPAATSPEVPQTFGSIDNSNGSGPRFHDRYNRAIQQRSDGYKSSAWTRAPHKLHTYSDEDGLSWIDRQTDRHTTL